MGSKLEELQSRKIELENELRSLNKKEKILAGTTKILEEILEAKSEEKIKSSREGLSKFADAQVKLKQMKMKEKTGTLETGLTLGNRVRLNGNVVFSWSYQKLPNSRLNQRGIS